MLRKSLPLHHQFVAKLDTNVLQDCPQIWWPCFFLSSVEPNRKRVVRNLSSGHQQPPPRVTYGTSVRKSPTITLQIKRPRILPQIAFFPNQFPRHSSSTPLVQVHGQKESHYSTRSLNERNLHLQPSIHLYTFAYSPARRRKRKTVGNKYFQDNCTNLFAEKGRQRGSICTKKNGGSDYYEGVKPQWPIDN